MKVVGNFEATYSYIKVVLIGGDSSCADDITELVYYKGLDYVNGDIHSFRKKIVANILIEIIGERAVSNVIKDKVEDVLIGLGVLDERSESELNPVSIMIKTEYDDLSTDFVNVVEIGLDESVIRNNLFEKFKEDNKKMGAKLKNNAKRDLEKWL